MVLDDRRERCRPSRGFQEMETARNQRLPPLATSCRPFRADSRRTSFLLNAGLLSKGPPGQASPGSGTSSLKLAIHACTLYVYTLSSSPKSPPSSSAEILMLRAADIYRSQSNEERVRDSAASDSMPTASPASRHCRPSVAGLASSDSPKSLPAADLGLLSPKTRRATEVDQRQNAPAPALHKSHLWEASPTPISFTTTSHCGYPTPLRGRRPLPQTFCAKLLCSHPCPALHATYFRHICRRHACGHPVLKSLPPKAFQLPSDFLSPKRRFATECCRATECSPGDGMRRFQNPRPRGYYCWRPVLLTGRRAAAYCPRPSFGSAALLGGHTSTLRTGGVCDGREGISGSGGDNHLLRDDVARQRSGRQVRFGRLPDGMQRQRAVQ
jgi:hypothetical protein